MACCLSVLWFSINWRTLSGSFMIFQNHKWDRNKDKEWAGFKVSQLIYEWAGHGIKSSWFTSGWSLMSVNLQVGGVWWQLFTSRWGLSSVSWFMSGWGMESVKLIYKWVGFGVTWLTSRQGLGSANFRLLHFHLFSISLSLVFISLFFLLCFSYLHIFNYFTPDYPPRRDWFIAILKTSSSGTLKGSLLCS